MTMLVPLQATISTVVAATGDRAIANVFESVFAGGSFFLFFSSRVRWLFRIDRRCAAQQQQLDCFVITVSSRRSARNLSPCEGFVSRPVVFFWCAFLLGSLSSGSPASCRRSTALHKTILACQITNALLPVTASLDACCRQRRCRRLEPRRSGRPVRHCCYRRCSHYCYENNSSFTCWLPPLPVPRHWRRK